MEIKVSLSNVISKRIYDNGWRDMTEGEQIMYLEQIKNVLRGLARNKKSKFLDAVNRMSVSNLPGNCGKLERLKIDEYVAFQSYPDEIKVIKEIITKEC